LAGVVDHCRSIAGWDVVGAGAACLASCSWREHSAAGQLVARAVFLSPPYLVAEEELSVLLESIKQNGDYADIACLTGSKDDYYYSTQAMSENYAAMSLQVVEQDICRAIAHAVRFECQTYPRPYKVAMLMQAPYYFQEAQIEAAIAAMDVAPEYADIRQVESSTAVLYLFSERPKINACSGQALTQMGGKPFASRDSAQKSHLSATLVTGLR
jgi:hypothetical protein